MNHIKKQIYELAQNDAVVYGSIQNYEINVMTWAEAMEIAVIRLAKMNQILLKDLFAAEMKRPRIIQTAADNKSLEPTREGRAI